MDDLTGWRKSSYSFSNGNCAEAGTCANGVAVRDSKDPDGPVLTFSGPAWGRFTGALKQGAAPAA
jgi:hypothetical protein